MGHGIAQITAQAGMKITAVEVKQDALDAGMKR
jgi:3-hydroxyacyl-CoA dehydrogenase